MSALGDTGDRAYTVYEDDKTSLDRYRVLLPTWNATIEVPFTPLFQPGHLYFPAYRESRVLVAVGFDRASLLAFLDWGESVRLPWPARATASSLAATRPARPHCATGTSTANPSCSSGGPTRATSAWSWSSRAPS